MIAFLVANWGYIATALWGFSELLNAIPSVKSSSVLELIVNIVESISAGHVVSPNSQSKRG